MFRPVISNLGFLLQMAGIFNILPVCIGLYFGEDKATISIFITIFAFFASGFLFNSFCERRELDFKSSCTLLVIVFAVLSLIGAIPYFYLNIFQPQTNVFDLFTNSYFQSMSAFSATGFTLLPNVDALPRSLVLYMSLSQWVGGIGIIFVLLVFFYPARKLEHLGQAISAVNLKDIRSSFYSVVNIYTIYTIVFSGFLMLLGLDFVKAVSFTMSGLATGGLAPVTDTAAVLNAPIGFVISLTLLFGAVNINVHRKLLSGKFRKLFDSELVVFLGVIIVSSFLLTLIQQINLADSFFHIISGSSTTGYGYLNLANFNDNSKILFILIMFIGACTSSTGGGIKIFRLIVFLKSIPWAIRKLLGYPVANFHVGNENFEDGIILVLSYIALSIIILTTSAFIFTFNGFSFIDSFFEVTSAIGGVGFSVGIASLSLSAPLKWVLSLIMLIGRVEIIVFLTAFINFPIHYLKNTAKSVITKIQNIRIYTTEFIKQIKTQVGHKRTP
ncbi:MAG: trk/ktr system potassium uptake protein [Thermoproteota archaeon]|nr:trk/ktr system potassium uptake protein [Thermoproteota archaeon]